MGLHMRFLAFIVCLILFFAPFPGISEVLVKGVFPGAEGEEIRLMETMDLISYRSKEVDACIIDENGAFAFRVHIDSPGQMFFRIMHARIPFYVAPGQEYWVSFDPVDPGALNEQHHQVPLRQHFPVTIRNKYEGDPDLNLMTEKLNVMVADYLQTSVAGNIRANHRHSLGDFKSRLDSAFHHVRSRSAFFDDYVRYYVSYLERTLNTKSFDALVESFLHCRPILYSHPMYMDFFQAMFDTYLFGGSRSISPAGLNFAVNRQASYRALMDTLAKDTMFYNVRFRELVMLNGLRRMLGMADFDNRMVVEILRQARHQSTFSLHAAIAENILEQHLALKPGTPAPGFSLTGPEGDTLRLEDYQGRYLYLFFGAGWCPVSMAEAGAMSTLTATFDDTLHILGVLIDNATTSISGILEDDASPFRLLHFGGDYRLLDDYRVRTVPQYLLIDPDGNIAAFPFVSPSAGAAEKIEDFINK